MASAIDDEDLSMARPSNSSRRGTNRTSTSDNIHRPAQSSHGSNQRYEQLKQRSNRLGQYTIVRTLGEGSFGKVKLAVNDQTGQQVALKIISRKKLVTRDMAGRIEREIQYLQLLRHPHIIKLYTVLTTSAEIIMVLEYAGTELFDYIVQHGKLTEEKGRRFFQQIVCAVEYCHRHKVVHRDLKPENLLLDENLNVKIADFGLSNIMTDGNFLKTSCGSPNYAAPEVISGKLYAGPEVDVWSCGVILYVLLVGRLPFDDDYIPALFKKIAAGQFYVPTYLSQGAARLIKKMLVVNPVSRMTIAEIRQDPWFNVDLADYLHLPREEFFNTGVDPNKALDIVALTSSKPAARLHESVIGKLGTTMGYDKNDVNDALSKSEPSAIKDAYNIVRENELRKESPSLAKEASLHKFFAQPPAPKDSLLASTPIVQPAKMAGNESGPASPPAADAQATAPQADAEQQTAEGSTPRPRRTIISHVGILPSSLPAMHREFMIKHRAKKAAAAAKAKAEAEAAGLAGTTPPQDNADSAAGTASSSDAQTIAQATAKLQSTGIDDPPVEGQTQSKQQQAVTSNHLKPHSKSTLALDSGEASLKEMTSLNKKVRAIRWQFGIRSRNNPAEAIAALYRALQNMNAEFEVLRADEIRHPQETTTAAQPPNLDHWSDGEADVDAHHKQPVERGRARDRLPKYGPHNDWGYEVAKDPWVINGRFKVDGICAPGLGQSSSTHSSRVDLTAVGEEIARRREASAGADNASHSGPASSVHESTSTTAGKTDESSIWVYFSIQLYQIEENFFLVDFKSSGYERIVSTMVREVKTHLGRGGWGWKPLAVGEVADPAAEIRIKEVLRGAGRMDGEKWATSPFPFLDVASKLVAHLAEGRQS